MIKVSQTTLPEVLRIERYFFEDYRGVCGEVYKKQEYFDAGIKIEFVEQDYSLSHKNVLRGLHGDPKTWKLISCLYGELYLVVMNYNETSPSFGKWEAFTLTPRNCLQILIPPMHANGYLILSDWAVFHYNQSEYYTDGKNQFTVKWNDPRFNITWPTGNPILSRRDS
ncbi:MAG: hypothetical protein A3F48_00970 [Candidatus Yanofskybacteria bacterium RIFCSPHIGHO2_12_FULL_41_9]|nr:MAG: hypothetical protein A3F48_00970 [Candidatus Yanofskybacteria bacterium RIFCSPHIGHO2_12_FULL_41_9]